MFNFLRKTKRAVQHVETVFEELLKDDVVIFTRDGSSNAEIVERVTSSTVYTSARSQRGFWYEFARPIERVEFVYRGVDYDTVLAAIEENSNCHQN